MDTRRGATKKKVKNKISKTSTTFKQLYFFNFARLRCADACFMYLDLLDVTRVYTVVLNYNLPHQP